MVVKKQPPLAIKTALLYLCLQHVYFIPCRDVRFSEVLTRIFPPATPVSILTLPFASDVPFRSSALFCVGDLVIYP